MSNTKCECGHRRSDHELQGQLAALRVWEPSSLSTWFPLTAKEIDDLRAENRTLVARAEAAEAARDTANAKLRVMESRMKQVHAALLASMSDEQLKAGL